MYRYRMCLVENDEGYDRLDNLNEIAKDGWEFVAFYPKRQSIHATGLYALCRKQIITPNKEQHDER